MAKVKIDNKVASQHFKSGFNLTNMSNEHQCSYSGIRQAIIRKIGIDKYNTLKEKNKKQKIRNRKEKLILLLKELTIKLGHAPVSSEIKSGICNPSTYVRYFGSIQKASKLVKI